MTVLGAKLSQKKKKKKLQHFTNSIRSTSDEKSIKSNKFVKLYRWGLK